MFLTQLRRSGSGKNVVTPLPLVKRKEVETDKEISKQLNKETGKENGAQEGFTQFRTPSSISKRVPPQVQFACGHFKRHILAFELLLFRQTSQAPRPAAASALCCHLRSFSPPKRQIWQARLSFKRFFYDTLQAASRQGLSISKVSPAVKSPFEVASLSESE